MVCAGARKERGREHEMKGWHLGCVGAGRERKREQENWSGYRAEGQGCVGSGRQRGRWRERERERERGQQCWGVPLEKLVASLDSVVLRHERREVRAHLHERLVLRVRVEVLGLRVEC